MTDFFTSHEGSARQVDTLSGFGKGANWSLAQQHIRARTAALSRQADGGFEKLMLNQDLR
jgi:hypothetical protein